MLNVVEEKYQQLRNAVERQLGVVEAQRQTVATLTTEVKDLNDEIAILTFTSTALEQLLKAVSVESLETVEQLVTYGLRTIFDDQALGFKIEVGTKFKQQWMDPKLVQGAVSGPILDSYGGGPATVVSFLLRLLVCRRLGLAPVLILDEQFSMVSAEYVENVAKLLRELADKLGFTFILVTHDRGFLTYAHHGYEAKETSGGTIFEPVKSS